jgi:hypothetical protein
MLKLIPFVICSSIVVMVILIPFWVPRLRKYREIRAAVDRVNAQALNCGGAGGCAFASSGGNLLAVAGQTQLAPALCLVYCIGNRLEKCLGEWQADELSRLFRNVLLCLLILTGVLALALVAEELFPSLGTSGWSAKDVLVYGLFSAVSVSEIIIAIELRAQYRELVKMGDQMITDIRRLAVMPVVAP